jgi:hypothetical protein
MNLSSKKTAQPPLTSDQIMQIDLGALVKGIPQQALKNPQNQQLIDTVTQGVLMQQINLQNLQSQKLQQEIMKSMSTGGDTSGIDVLKQPQMLQTLAGMAPEQRDQMLLFLAGSQGGGNMNSILLPLMFSMMNQKNQQQPVNYVDLMKITNNNLVTMITLQNQNQSKETPSQMISAVMSVMQPLMNQAGTSDRDLLLKNMERARVSMGEKVG